MGFTVTEEKWTISAHHLLLTALEMYGDNQWGKVRHFLDYHGHHFSKSDIEKHFEAYIQGNDNMQKYLPALMEVTELNNYRISLKKSWDYQQKMGKESYRRACQAYNPKRREYAVNFDS